MWYDVICLAILLFSAWRGMLKGFVWQIASIAGIILCFFFAETVSVAVAPMTGLEPPLSRWVSIFGLYLVGSFVAFAMAKTIKTGLEKAKFEDYDRHLGGIFGFVKGATLCLVLSFFLFTLSEQTREMVFDSQAGYYSAVLFEQIEPVMPEELDALLKPHLQGFDKETIAQYQHQHPTNPSTDNENQPPDSDANPFEAPSPFGNASQSQESDRDATLLNMIQQVPGVFSEDLKNIIYQALEQTEPEDRPDLIQELSSGVPGLMRQVAEQWKQGKPTQQPPSEPEQDWRQYRAQLLREISGGYTEHLAAQQAIMEEVVYSLHGVPDQVTVKVLEDWHADLMKKEPDPDPGTNLYTMLDQRVLRQLEQARISLSSLPASLQDRLNSLK